MGKRNAFVTFMTRYGANVGGTFWNAGAALLFIFGVAASSPREIIAAVLNVASPCAYMLFGHRNGGVVLGASLGLIGTFLAVEPEIARGEPGSTFGFAIFCVCIALGIFSAPLAKRFGRARNAFWRKTLGHPRRLAGYAGIFLVRLPIIVESIAHHRWQLAIIFALWAMGDFAYSFSKPEVKTVVI